MKTFTYFLPFFSGGATTATGHQNERTLSPGTYVPDEYNSQPGTQYSGESPTASSVQSQT